MRSWRFAVGGAAALAVAACGGLAQQSSNHVVGGAGESQLGSGGNEANNAGLGSSGSGGPNATPGGSGGSTNIDLPIAGGGGAPPGIRAGSACQLTPPSCHVVDQFIELEDGTRLAYPLDTSCGQCSFKCEVCDELTCSLWATAATGCGKFQLRLAACAGLEGNPPCLDSASDNPYYIDASGKRWALGSLIGSETQLPDPVPNGSIVLDLELTISDGTTTRAIAARAQVCATFYAVLVICN